MITERLSAEQKARIAILTHEANRRVALALEPSLTPEQRSLKYGIPLDCIYSLSPRNSLKPQPESTFCQLELVYA
jgi:hypothetical protein